MELYFDDVAQKKLVSGIKKLSKAVKATLGAQGRTVMLASMDHTGGSTITKDGVTVAKQIILEDPVEEMAASALRQAASRTAQMAGDGTSTSIVLAEALISLGFERITAEHNSTRVLREIKRLTDLTVKLLKTHSIRVTGERIKHVASISANGDTKVGKLIADCFKKVGKDGVVITEKSYTGKTSIEVASGIRLDRGFSSQLFINNHRRDEFEAEGVRILLTDMQLNHIGLIEQAIRPFVVSNTPILFIAPCSQGMLGVIAQNVHRNNLRLCAIEPPSFGYKSHDLMGDIALATGGAFYSEKAGNDLTLLRPEHFGYAAKVTIGRYSSTLVVEQSPEVAQKCSERIAELKEALSMAKTAADKAFIEQRIGVLSGKIGIISVGGDTDIEQKELYDRVDDSVCAVRSALQEGVVPGAGKMLFELADKISAYRISDASAEELADLNLAMAIFRAALREPLEQILANAGLESDPYYNNIFGKHEGIDANTGEHVNLIDAGIIDPAKVVRCALESAVSVATTILSTAAVYTRPIRTTLTPNIQ